MDMVHCMRRQTFWNISVRTVARSNAVGGSGPARGTKTSAKDPADRAGRKHDWRSGEGTPTDS